MCRFPIFLAVMILVAGLIVGVRTWAQPPFFARAIPVDTTPKTASLSALGLGRDGNYLIIWQRDAGDGNSDIWARRARLDADFQWLDPAFAIANSANSEYDAAMAYNPLDDEFLVTYSFAYAPDDIDVRAQRVTGDAEAADPLIGGPLSVGVTTGNERTPDVAFLPTTGHYLIVYELDGDIWGRRVGRPGQADFIGDEFVIAQDSAPEQSPVVAAATADAYFLVAYVYIFSPDDQDVLAQRVRGTAQQGQELLGNGVPLADSSANESGPALIYHDNARAFMLLWHALAPAHESVHCLWIDARDLTDNPAIGAARPIITGERAMVREPHASIDPDSSQVLVALAYADGPGSWHRPALIWLSGDPYDANLITSSLQALPAQSFDARSPTALLQATQTQFLMGYTAQWGVSPEADQDAYLLATSRWGIALPLLQKR